MNNCSRLIILRSLFAYRVKTSPLDFTALCESCAWNYKELANLAEGKSRALTTWSMRKNLVLS